MSEPNLELQLSHELNAEHEKLSLFQAEYCDPNRDILELYKGKVVRFSTIHFYGQTDNEIIVLRAGIHSTEQVTEQVFWLGTYDLTRNEPIIFDVTDRDTHLEPFLRATGAYRNVYEAKSRDDESKTIQFHMGSTAVEWVHVHNNIRYPVTEIPQPGQL